MLKTSCSDIPWVFDLNLMKKEMNLYNKEYYMERVKESNVMMINQL